MIIRSDPVNAFLDYGDVEVPSAAEGPLAGLTFAVKDIFDVAGYPTGDGSPLRRAESPLYATTAPIVQKMLDAGARFVGKTQTDEMTFSMNGQNRHFPEPVNVRASRAHNRRFVIRLGGGSRREALRLRNRLGHWWVGACAGKLLRPLGHPPDSRESEQFARPAACVLLRHGRLLHRRRQPLRADRTGFPRGGRAGVPAYKALPRRRCLHAASFQAGEGGTQADRRKGRGAARTGDAGHGRSERARAMVLDLSPPAGARGMGGARGSGSSRATRS